MGYDIVGEDDILGEEVDILGEELDEMLGEEDDDLLVGAARRRRAARARQAQRGAAPRGIRPPPIVSRTPGVTGPALARIPLGFGTLSCSAGTNPSGGTLTSSPQVPIRPRRLIIVVNGTNAANYAVAISSLLVGTKSLLGSAQSVDARAFTADAVGAEILGENAGPGVTLSLTVVVSPAVSGTDTVLVTPTLLCDSIN